MNFKIAITLLAAAIQTYPALAKDDVFSPNRISHESLTADPLHTANDSILVDSLSTEGFVSITGIPGFGKTKRDLMSHLHACIMDQGDAFPQQTFKDGTVRRTIGTVTIPGAGAQPVAFKEGEELSASCQEFNRNLGTFRDTVDETTAAFAGRLSFEMGSSLSAPLMSTQDGSHVYNDIKEVVASGHHLEHFHSYQKTKESSSEIQTTIDLHADQGFFIAFSPGLVVAHNDDKAPNLSKPLVESEGFYVETSDGKRSLVQFNAEDDLVFMLGDGVNQ